MAKALFPSDRQAEPAFSEDGLTKLVLHQIRTTAGLTSTMLQDVRAGRQTEIDYINGYISAQAERLGIPCPKNEKIIEMVKSGTKVGDSAIAGHFFFKCELRTGAARGCSTAEKRCRFSWGMMENKDGCIRLGTLSFKAVSDAM